MGGVKLLTDNIMLPTMSTCGSNLLLWSLLEVIRWSMGAPKV
jgi:hypothetical protein